MKVTANGKTFNFPDGTSQEDIGAAIDEYFAKEAATNTPPKSSYTPEIKPLISSPTTLPYGMKQADIDSANERIKRKNEYERSFIGDEERQRIKKEESERPFLSSVVQGIGQTMTQLKEGGKDIADKYLPEALSTALHQYINPLQANQVAPSDERIAEREKFMDELAQRYQITSGENPIGTTIGEMLPYIATGNAGSRVLGAAVEAASPVTRQVITKVLSKTSPAEAQRFASRVNIPDHFSRRVSEVAKAPVIGAAEGGVQYDGDAATGALYSTLGAAGATVGPLKILSKVENVRDNATKGIINQMHKEGFELTPGVRTGNRQMQMEEAGMRNSDLFGDYYYQKVDRPNERKMTELAGEAIGLNGKGRDAFAQDELSSHMSNLSDQYKKLEANTTGKFGSKEVKTIGDVLKDLQPTQHRNTSPADKSRYQVVKSIVDTMTQEISSPKRGANGRFQGYQYDGSQYQAIRQRIQQEASQAYSNGDKRLGDALSKIRTTLDDSIANGMNKTTAAQWRDLNERYAMTRLLLEKGMTPSGRIDPLGITSAVMDSDEAIRTLTGKGGRIKQFQKIARYNDVLNNVEGGTLTGLGGADKGADRNLSKLPWKYRIPLAARGVASYRISRLPTIGFEPEVPIQIGRAVGASNPTDNAKNAGLETFQDMLDFLKGN